MQKLLIIPLSPRNGVPVPKLGPYSTPFCYAVEAWFWAVGAISSRHDGCRRGSGNRVARPCEPVDVVKCFDRLYQKRRITLGQARVLWKWGERHLAPSCRHASEVHDAVLWNEAIMRLEGALRAKGIVA